MESEEKLFAIVLDRTLASEYALNATAHLAAQFGTFYPEIRGSTLVDRSEGRHRGLPIYGNLILACEPDKMRDVLARACSSREEIGADNAIDIFDFTQEGYLTATDEELVEQVSQRDESSLTYRAFLFYGDKKVIRKITKKLSLWNDE